MNSEINAAAAHLKTFKLNLWFRKSNSIHYVKKGLLSITKLTAELIQKSKNNRESAKTQQPTALENNSIQKEDDDVFNKLNFLITNFKIRTRKNHFRITN